ncbi:hypothetical protein CSUI_006473 [Cystoisospora suis]|uniref:Uncharacterized protein n=1 Tax=Cystoisospora suis TaxID=483139 RepID=A0A2C6KU01_9APIC|nr:hypothetical protein CSUI_006473 [Cystoisospora suis]
MAPTSRQFVVCLQLRCHACVSRLRCVVGELIVTAPGYIAYRW